MGRKKVVIMAVDVLQPDTQHPADERVCRNFVCYEQNVKECFINEIRKEDNRNDPKTNKEIETICGYQTELRGGIGNLGMDLVSVLPVTLEKTVKSMTPYIYRTIDYNGTKTDTTFGTKKDAIQTIQKRIKSKKVIMHYNGITEKCDFDIARVEEILGSLEKDTVDFDIEAVMRNPDDNTVLVSIYKNCIKL